jgi:hypothetical protein
MNSRFPTGRKSWEPKINLIIWGSKRRRNLSLIFATQKTPDLLINREFIHLLSIDISKNESRDVAVLRLYKGSG